MVAIFTSSLNKFFKISVNQRKISVHNGLHQRQTKKVIQGREEGTRGRKGNKFLVNDNK